MILVDVISAICQAEIKQRELSAKDFARLLPCPPDPLLEAVREAIIGFFPTGRHSYVREVMETNEQMAAKSNEVLAAEAEHLVKNPRTPTRMQAKARKEIERIMNETFPLDQ